MGAYEKAPQWGADTGKGHALSFPLHLRALTSKQRLIKKKTCIHVCQSHLFYLWLHVPFRIEAVIKILTTTSTRRGAMEPGQHGFSRKANVFPVGFTRVGHCAPIDVKRIGSAKKAPFADGLKLKENQEENSPF